MHTIITQPAREAHPDLDAAARKRADRLAKATTDQLQAALAYLSMIDPEAFEIAFTAVAPPPPTTSPKTKSPSRCAPPAAPRSASSPNSSSAGATSAATPSPAAPTRPTTPATPPRSPGTSPTRTRKSSRSNRSRAPPVFRRGTVPAYGQPVLAG